MLIAQWLITFLIAGILFVIRKDWAVSAFLGGLICALPNVYFARQVFTKHRTAQPHLLLGTIYLAEFIKLGIAFILFAIVFIKYKDVHPLALIITYLIVHSCMWLVPLVTPNSSNRIIKQTH